MKRNIIGAVLFLILVGEVTVGFVNGLFTPPGFIALFILYFLYFRLLDALVLKYNLNNVGIVLVNFALYSVFITGFLHGEIADYVLPPENQLITTLIRVQCSFYPLYAFYLLRKIAPVTASSASPAKALGLLLVFFALLSKTNSIGYGTLANTIKIAPLLSIFFISFAALALFIAIRTKGPTIRYENKNFGKWALVMFFVGLIPGLFTFLVLMGIMIVVSIKYLTVPAFRRTTVVL